MTPEEKELHWTDISQAVSAWAVMTGTEMTFSAQAALVNMMVNRIELMFQMTDDYIAKIEAELTRAREELVLLRDVADAVRAMKMWSALQAYDAWKRGEK